ncbi:tape measure protein [Gardnerella swidsinskii]|uniref:Phage tail tape measure protein n=1 Tax=Gardnerella swidsinskii TaxID=2792979 RepID=A0ABM6GKD0_9BIFI|nr:phage tail tape measure protein [Gardnerella vaginalis]
MAKGDTGINIARAFVEIVPSTKGVGKAICDAFNNANNSVSQKGSESGKKYAVGFNQNVSKIGSNIAQKLTSANSTVIQKGSQAGTGYASTFSQKAAGIGGKIQQALNSMASHAQKSGENAGSGFAKGFGLKMGMISGIAQSVTSKIIGAFGGITSEIMSASDSAQKFGATLQFAGVSNKQIKELTKSTQTYADKTVYDLEDIRSTTAQLASNGVKGYDKLAEAAGNLNAIAGGNKETFKSVAMVLTQTAGAGKLTADNWRQLSQAIPGASGKIQEQLKKNGVYTGNFADAMRQGKITSEAFNQALLDLGFDDVAVKAAQSTVTIEGAWGNLQASVVKAGMVIFDSIKGPTTQAMSAIADAIGDLTNSMQAPLAAAISGVVDWFGKLFAAMQNVGVFESFKAIWQSLCDIFKEVFSIVGGWGALFPPEALAVALKVVLDLLNGVLQVVKFLAPVLTPLAGIWLAWAGAIKAVQIATSIWSTVTKIATAVQAAFNVVMNMNPIGALIAVIAAVVAGLIWFFTQTELGKQIWQGLCDVFMSFINAIGTALQATLSFIGNAWNAYWSSISSFFTNIWNGIQAAAQAAWNWLTSTLNSICQGISSAWNACWSGISSFFTNIWNGIKGFAQGVWNGIKNTLGGVLNGITGAWNACWNGIKNFFSNIWNGIKNGAKAGIDAVFHFVTGLKDRILGFFRGAGQWLLNAGKAILDGFLKGLKGAWDGVCNFVGGIGNWIAEHKGPISYDKKLLIPAGKAIMQGFSKGLGDSWQGVQKQVAGFTKQSGNWFNDTNAIRLRTTVMPPDGGWNAQQNQIAKVAANYEVDASRTGLTKQDLYDAFDGVMSQGVALKLNGRGGEVMAGILAKPMNNELNKMATLGR